MKQGWEWTQPISSKGVDDYIYIFMLFWVCPQCWWWLVHIWLVPSMTSNTCSFIGLLNVHSSLMWRRSGFFCKQRFKLVIWCSVTCAKAALTFSWPNNDDDPEFKIYVTQFCWENYRDLSRDKSHLIGQTQKRTKKKFWKIIWRHFLLLFT